MCLPLFSVIFLCMNFPAGRTSGADIHMRTLKTGTWSHQVDGRRRQKDTWQALEMEYCTLGPRALLNRVCRAQYCTDSTLVTPKGPQAFRNMEYWRSLNIYHNLVWLKGRGGGGGVPRYICSSWERELRTCYSKAICFSTSDNICELIVTWKEDVTA